MKETIEGQLSYTQDWTGKEGISLQTNSEKRIALAPGKKLAPIFAIGDFQSGQYRFSGKFNAKRQFVFDFVEYLGDKKGDEIEGTAQEKAVLKTEDAPFVRCVPTVFNPEINMEPGKKYRIEGIRSTPFLMRVRKISSQ